MARGKSSGESRMQTTGLHRRLRNRVAGVAVVGAVIGIFMFVPAAAADGGCGRVGGGGSRGCPPAPNPTPLTISFTMPGRDDAVVVTVTLTRGLQQARTGPPGSPPDLQVRTFDTNSQ